MAINSRQFVEDKNKFLFDSLELRGYKIIHDFQTHGWPNDHAPWSCEVNRNNKTAVIKYYVLNPKTLGYYTHELFHIDQIDKGFLTNHELITILPASSTDFYPIGHINNIIAHQKFYQDFINLGYLPSEFLVDYEITSNDEINNKVELLKKYFASKNKHIVGGMADYIGMFFSFIFNPWNENLYSRQLQSFQQIDTELYSILRNNWEGWVNSNSLDNLSFFKSLLKELDMWRSGLAIQ